MAIRPAPITYHCTSCHWSKTVHPKSDCLMPGIDDFEDCPKCGKQTLETTSASTLEKIILNTFESINKITKNP